jgi:uncharacterized OB-fold protein
VKPVPEPDQDSAAYWSAAAERRLLVQRCGSCGHAQLYPRLFCCSCHGSDLAFEDALGTGEVYATTVVRRAPSTAFAEDVPYAVTLVRLAEGPLVMANVVGCAPEDVVVGMPVTVEYGDVRGETVVPRFVPA